MWLTAMGHRSLAKLIRAARGGRRIGGIALIKGILNSNGIFCGSEGPVPERAFFASGNFPQDPVASQLICKFSIGIGIAFQAAPHPWGDAY